MNTQILNAPGELFLGSDTATALALGSRHFRLAANAVRFAMEHAAPVSLRGAMLKIGNKTFGPAEIKQFHRNLRTGLRPDHHKGRTPQRYLRRSGGRQFKDTKILDLVPLTA